MAAPMGPAVAGKNDWSISFVNTPGLRIFSAICCLQNLGKIRYNYSYINIT
jgi:hypothetical protein